MRRFLCVQAAAAPMVMTAGRTHAQTGRSARHCRCAQGVTVRDTLVEARFTSMEAGVRLLHLRVRLLNSWVKLLNLRVRLLNSWVKLLHPRVRLFDVLFGLMNPRVSAA